MSGMAGNKGAVAIRMDYANTSICLVTAHLAAGFANYEERNQDYRTISHGLRFQRNRTIEDHDTIIWLGDFNYRIGMNNERTRALVDAGDLETLYANDQLNLQMVHGKTFPFYHEARITFLPTYKYDLGTDDYDSSDKARIPAWCDRILTKGNNLRQINYETAPLKFSDHRPVWANFQCTVTVVDEKHKDNISEQLYRQRRTVVGDSTANTHAEDTDDEDLLGYESIEPSLPPASSDRRKWWLDGGQPARSQVKGPSGPEYKHNAARPANPFAQTNEPDWVKVDKPMPPPPRTLTMRGGAPPAVGGSSAGDGNMTPKPAQTLRKLPPPWQGQASSSKATTSSSSNNNPSHEQEVLQSSQRITSASSERNTQQPMHPTPHLKQTLRKPVPPLVPKKPALLRSESGTSTSTQQHQERYRDEESPPSQPPRRGGTGMQVGTPSSVAANSVPFPPPPRRSTFGVQVAGPQAQGAGVSRSASIASSARGSGYAPSPPQARRANRVSSNNEDGEERGPPLPARVGAVAAEGGYSRSASPGGSLMDDDESDRTMKGWTTLKPT